MNVNCALRARGKSAHRYLVEACRARHEGRVAPSLLRATVSRLETELAGTAARAASKPTRPSRRRRDGLAGGPDFRKGLIYG